MSKKTGPADGGTYAAKIKDRWPPRAPDWIVVLAQAADAEVGKGGNLGSLGSRLSVSGSSLSAVLGNKYPGGLQRIEARVRGKLMSATVTCPVLGEIGRDACANNQERKFSAANPRLVRLATACPQCPHNLGGK